LKIKINSIKNYKKRPAAKSHKSLHRKMDI